MPDVFLSYSREDQATARRFAEALEREGFSVWWDQSLRTGENYDRVTEAALRDAGAVVVLWSRASVDSQWVRSEATSADRRGALLPVMIEPCERPVMFELKHTAELAHWKGDADDPSWRSFVDDARRQVGKDVDAQAPTTPRAAPKSAVKHRLSTTILRVSLVLLGLLAVGAGAMLWSSSGDRSGPVTLAVLPFANLSSDPEQEYFSDGLTEEILNQLAQFRELRVTGRTSSFSFKGRNEDLRDIAGQLGVENLLEGSVRRDGGSVRITAQLIDGRDGGHLWSKTYARELSDVFALQEEIARDVAQALRIKLDVGEMSRARGGTTNVEAYEAYLRGMEVWRTGSGLSAGVQRLREAVVLDPSFAQAWFALSAFIPPLEFQEPQNAAALRREREEARRRLMTLLPPEGSLAAEVRAIQAWEAHRWADALAGMESLLAAAPNDSGKAFAYALFLSSVGRFDDAVTFRQRLIRSEPLNFANSRQLALTLELAGRHEEAEAEYERSASLVTTPEVRGYEELRRLYTRRDIDDAVVRTAITRFLLEGGANGLLRWSGSQDGKPGDPTTVLAALRQALDEPFNQSQGPLHLMAMIADAFGDRQLAVAALRRNYVDLQTGWVAGIWENSVRSGLRTEPAFKDLLRDLRIVDYWRATGSWGDFCKPVGEDDFECR